MIEVRHLTKRYGGHTAVSDLSFTIEKGRIYGFLGPNGAGKSTTMNIITGCLGASEGDVFIGGIPVLEEPLAAKKLVGYLPELPPVYMDMTVSEYLRFVLRAKGVPKKDWARQLSAVVGRTKLEEVQDRLIGNLSKGYRQRVGIAQALLGDPEVIILDEPTVGLDPAQIIEIRELIRELGRDHTVVLSSHILSEVRAVCDHIMIISRGKMVASDTPENLERLFAGTTTLHLTAKGTEEQARNVMDGMPGVKECTYAAGQGETKLTVIPEDGEELREALFRRFAAADCPLLEMTRDRVSLEDIFLELTGSEKEAEKA